MLLCVTLSTNLICGVFLGLNYDCIGLYFLTWTPSLTVPPPSPPPHPPPLPPFLISVDYSTPPSPHTQYN